MASNAYKTQSITSNKTIVELLIAGFFSQLKGWWDFHLSKQQQSNIFIANTNEEYGEPVLDHHREPIQDVVSTLIFTISHHFIGYYSHLKDKNVDLLSNLQCKKMSDFQKYKNTFLSRVMLREDSNRPFKKEKFLARLPSLFRDKVRNKICETYGNHIIPYDRITYGELISFTQKQRLQGCQDLKLQKQMKWELKSSHRELGSFRKQFDNSLPRTKHYSGNCSKKPISKSYS